MRRCHKSPAKLSRARAVKTRASVQITKSRANTRLCNGALSTGRYRLSLKRSTKNLKQCKNVPPCNRRVLGYFPPVAQMQVEPKGKMKSTSAMMPKMYLTTWSPGFQHKTSLYVKIGAQTIGMLDALKGRTSERATRLKIMLKTTSGVDKPRETNMHFALMPCLTLTTTIECL